MKHYIAPDLQSHIHHLRGRACWAMGHLFVLLDKSSDFYIQVLRCVIQMLRDPELPVRFQVSLLAHEALSYSCRRPYATQMLRDPELPVRFQVSRVASGLIH